MRHPPQGSGERGREFPMTRVAQRSVATLSPRARDDAGGTRWIALWMLSSVVALGVDGAATLERRPRALVGTVVDTAGTPVAGAQIMAGSEEQGLADALVVAETGPDGRFQMEDMPTRTALDLQVRREGYAPAGLRVAPAVASAPAGLDLRIVLKAGLTVTGRVMDAAEEPIAGVEAWLTPVEAPGPGWAVSARSDSLGRLVFQDVAVGDHDLTTVATGYRPWTVPGVSVARPEGGTQVPIGIVVLAPDLPRRGQIFDPDGAAIVGARVVCSWSTAGTRHASPAVDSDGEGRFVLYGLPAATPCELEVRADGYRTAHATLRPSGDATPRRVVLERVLALVGEAVDVRGWPVEGARVMAEQGGASETGTTDEEGRFQFTDLASGDVAVTAETDDSIAAARTVTLRSVDASVRLVLEPGSVLSGTVIDPDGAPVTDATVRIIVDQPGRVASSEATADATHRLTTDAVGRFRSTVLAAGRYRVSTHHPSYRAVTRGLTVDDAQPATIDLQFVARRSHEALRVRGRVVDSTDAAVAQARVQLVGVANPVRSTTQSGGDGSFQLDAPVPGRYRLEAHHPHRGATLGPIFVLSDDQAARTRIVRLEATGVVAGRLAGVPAEALSAVSIEASSGHARARRGRVRHDGTYRVAGLAPGTWTVQAVWGERRTIEAVEVTAEAPPARLDLAFDPVAPLQGVVVRADRPTPEARVVVSCPAVPFHGETTTDSAGQFRFASVPHGPCQLTAHTADDRARAGQQIVVPDAVDLVIELAGFVLAGRVVAADNGRPLAGVRVEVASDSGLGNGSLRTLTHPDGRFALELAVPGTFGVRFEKPGFALQERPVSAVPAGQGMPSNELAMWPSESATVRVVGPWGAVPSVVEVVVDNGVANGLALRAMHRPGLDGHIDLDGLGPGIWRVAVSADGAFAQTTLTVPGPPVPIVLGVDTDRPDGVP